jgi:hypothetical protein
MTLMSEFKLINLLDNLNINDETEKNRDSCDYSNPIKLNARKENLWQLFISKIDSLRN